METYFPRGWLLRAITKLKQRDVRLLFYKAILILIREIAYNIVGNLAIIFSFERKRNAWISWHELCVIGESSKPRTFDATQFVLQRVHVHQPALLSLHIQVSTVVNGSPFVTESKNHNNWFLSMKRWRNGPGKREGNKRREPWRGDKGVVKTR